jgi:protein tyrosine phosphatase (PTP) superfamily phosphohydrolase (DUF442 family)
MRIEDITNFMQVSENIASSGQPVETQFGSIAAADYRLVVNLAMPNSDSAIPEEGNIVTALKMTYVHIPVPFESPTVKHLQAFMKIMSSFANDKIWVHCVVNYRVSAFLYQYFRLSQGYSDAQAKNAILPSWQPNDTWQRFMAIDCNDVAL